MRKAIDVSVGIVSYGNESDIINNIESLLCNTDKKRVNLSIYIVNNHPHDKLTKARKMYENRIVFIDSDKNGGYGYGHNRVLLNELQSKYHLILNPDVTFTEDTISKLVDILESDNDKKIAVVTPQILNSDGTIQYIPRRYPRFIYILSSSFGFLDRFRAEYTMEGDLPTEVSEIDICTGAFMFMRTDLFTKVGGFDEDYFMYFEDFDLSLRLSKYGSIIFNPDTKVTHYWHRNSKKSKKMLFVQIKSMFVFFKKWGVRF